MDKTVKRAKVIIWSLILLVLIMGGWVTYGLIVHKTEFAPAYVSAIHALTYVSGFLLFLIAVMEVVSLFFDRDATVITVVLSVSILCGFLCSSDAVRIYFGGQPSERWITDLFSLGHFLFIDISMGTVLFFVVREFGMKVTKREYVFVIAGLALCAAAFYPASLLGIAFVPVIGLVLYVIYVAFKLAFHLHFTRSLTYPTIAVFGIAGILLDVALAYSLASSSSFSFSAFGLSSIVGMLTAFLFVSVYVHFVYRTTRKAYKSEQQEKKLKTLQSSVLKSQIAPHFLFNSLQAVKTNYHLSQQKGDTAIDLLSKHLRNYVESGDRFLVPFAKELDSVMTYVELVNIRTERPFLVIFDIDAEEFEVPTLSIETLIENAVRYSGVNEKEDGHIEISSFEKEGNVVIRIRDNGRGFDLGAVRKDAVGIKNSFERFRLLLNADCEIASSPGEGTEITIKIPKEARQ